jgi:hypothetical protein
VADHLSEQIVAAAAAALAGLATTGANVFASRVDPLFEANLPCLLVDQGNEEAQPGELWGFSRSLERRMELLVVAKVEQTTAYRTTANQIRKEVEIALASASLPGAKWVQPMTCVLELAGDGEKPIASATMTFSVLYVTALGAPDVPL